VAEEEVRIMADLGFLGDDQEGAAGAVGVST